MVGVLWHFLYHIFAYIEWGYWSPTRVSICWKKIQADNSHFYQPLVWRKRLANDIRDDPVIDEVVYDWVVCGSDTKHVGIELTIQPSLFTLRSQQHWNEVPPLGNNDRRTHQTPIEYQSPIHLSWIKHFLLTWQWATWKKLWIFYYVYSSRGDYDAGGYVERDDDDNVDEESRGIARNMRTRMLNPVQSLWWVITEDLCL